LGVGVAQAHGGCDLLHSGRSRGLRRQPQGRVGGMPGAGTSGAPPVIALQGEGAKDGVQGAWALVGFCQQGPAANRALEGLLGHPLLCGGAEDREHELSRLSLQALFQVAQGDTGSSQQVAEVGLRRLRPRLQQVVGNEGGVEARGKLARQCVAIFVRWGFK
jgi:hypothetical protein